jgi:hypothetical protein
MNIENPAIFAKYGKTLEEKIPKIHEIMYLL